MCSKVKTLDISSFLQLYSDTERFFKDLNLQKPAICEAKNTLNGINDRLDTTKEKISESEDIVIETINIKMTVKNEQSISEF